MRAVACFVVAAALAACKSEGGPATSHLESNEDHCSFDAPKGFEPRRDRGSLVLVGQGANAHATIAIRAVDLRDGGAERTPETVIPATRTALAELPDARLSGPLELDLAAYRAIELDVSFAPRSKHGARYERRDVVLFGDAHVFHVMATAPAGQLATLKTQIDAVVESLREEG